ncbi:MAG TPA: UxaA family hydrolase [Geminicoccus sp.]|uniref:UxaA family hydrolase n=1 Tax=Geminicoccus sp. TaxID=2024832 RepID=UPI002D1B8555|nr:UxaA family hydrolase [Geminicoccus sp.]HWL69575.1 UxaA family hydrolase [Geminicoccus sp.]
MTSDPRLLLLDPQDDILVAIGRIRRGEPIVVEGQEVSADADIALGHKVARHELEPGMPVRKYGVAIGRVTRPIPLGAHVHVHNIASNYTATHTLDDAKPRSGDA